MLKIRHIAKPKNVGGNFMIRLLYILLLLGLTKTSYSCCAVDDRTLTEKLFNGNSGTIFLCRIITFSIPDNGDNIRMIASDGSINGTATAEIIEVFFGKVDTNIVTLRAGSYMTVGKSYLIYTGGNGRLFGFGGNCDRWTKQISDNPIVVNELLILKQFSDIFKKQLSGKFKFTNPNNVVIAEGQYKKGKAVKIWRHFDDKGIIKSEFDFSKSTTAQFYSNGYIKNRQKTIKDTSIYENYCALQKDEMTFKVTEIKDKDGKVVSTIWWEYNHEHYPNGKLKFAGLLSRGKRIGVWRWYNDNGELTAEYDYKDEK